MENTVGHPRSWEFIRSPDWFFHASGPQRSYPSSRTSAG